MYKTILKENDLLKQKLKDLSSNLAASTAQDTKK